MSLSALLLSMQNNRSGKDSRKVAAKQPTDLVLLPSPILHFVSLYEETSVLVRLAIMARMVRNGTIAHSYIQGITICT